ncbi:MAG: hypothetical protein H6R04_380 [Burkholderiaceae bacterium]|nr:hypothetical protein [Burkholderiaceae bacterium]
MNKKILDGVVYTASLALCLALSWYAGADYNWDLRNYYLYGPHAYLNGLIGKDFMAGSFQSYLNPLPYVPFYLMVKAGWHSLVIGSVLATFHALNLFFLWAICKRVMHVPNDSPLGRWVLALLCLLLGTFSVLFLMELGASYADISLSVFVLAAVLLLLKGGDEPERLLLYTFVAGILLGAATGMKLTNAPFALAACVFGFLPGLHLQRRVKFFAVLGASGLIGGLLTAGHWCWILYREFGNPFFPLLNKVFRSPDFIAANHQHARFLPESLTDVMTLPFRMVDPVAWVYAEIIAPDMRFAVFFAACASLVLVAVLKHVSVVHEWLGAKALSGSQTVFVAYIAVGWLLWALVSSNGRYLIPLLLLIGPGCGVLLWRLLPLRYVKLILVLLLAVQMVQVYYAGKRRFNVALDWDGPWFKLIIPQKLTAEPHLSLSMNVLSNAFLAVFYHSDSRFVNIVGQNSLSLTTPGGQRLQRLLDEYRGRTRVIFEYELPIGSSDNLRKIYYGMRNKQLNQFGLRIDETDCLPIEHRPLLNVHFASGVQPEQVPESELYEKIMSCGLKPASIDPEIERARTRAAAILDKVQQTCPAKFAATSPAVFRSNNAWERSDMNTDLWIGIDDEDHIVLKRPRSPVRVLGTVSAFERGEVKLDCGQMAWQR